ncbi:MAG TPA: pitrilysin family protein [Limnochordia bacterium]|nr:pitrilysin family protein [Limnochordia bacterium]
MKRTVVVVLLCVTLLLSTAAASAAPVDPESTLIPLHMQVLDNGLRVIVKEIPAYPIAVVNMWVGAGSKDDPEGYSGLAHFFEHIMFKGTPTRPVGQVFKEVELLGGDTNAFTTLDCTAYYIIVPSEHVHQAMEIQADVIKNSLFDPRGIERERFVIYEEISLSKESIDEHLVDWAHQELFAGTAYGRPIAGTAEDLANVDREAMLRFHADYYVPNNMVLVVTGNVKAEDIFTQTRELYGDLQAKPLPAQEYVPVPVLDQVVYLEDTRAVNQSYVLLAHPAPGAATREAAALSMASIILAQGRGSRLYRQLVEKEQVATSVTGFYSGYTDVGIFVISAVFDPAERDRFTAVVRDELRRLQEEPVSPEELERARAMARSSVAFDTESSLNVALFLGGMEVRGGVMAAVNLSATLADITAADIQRAAQLYLDPNAYLHVEIRPEGGSVQ